MAESNSPVDADDDEFPPLAMLRAFAVAGRLQSFRDAARELRVTPSAVSHQVAGFERWIGAPLFERGTRQVRLTQLGQALSDELNVAMAMTLSSLARARQGATSTRMRIGAPELFVTTWLASRLARFEEQHPGLTIAVETSAGTVLSEDGIDVAICLSAAAPPGVIAKKLIDAYAIPLCAREVAASLGAPADLRGATLLHTRGEGPHWSDWLRAQDGSGIRPRREIWFDSAPAALEAAAAGHGVALGITPFVWDTIAARHLVCPIEAQPLELGAYFVTHRRADRSRPAPAGFAEWIAAEMRADIGRLRRNAPKALGKAGP